MTTAPLFFLVIAIAITSSSSWCHVSSYPSITTRSNLLWNGPKHHGKQRVSRSSTDFCNGLVSLHSHTASIVDDVIHSTITTPSPTRSNTPTKPPCHHLHLLSLPYSPKIHNETTDATQTSPVESILQKCWKWKDVALGDGADEFVPRALGDGAQYLIPRRRQRRRRRGRIEFIPRSTAIKRFQLWFVGMEISVVRDDVGLRVVLKTSRQKNGKIIPNEMEMAVPSESVFHPTASEFSKNFEETFIVEECSVLSTCARLNVILVLRSVSPAKLNDSSTNSGPHLNKNDDKEMAEKIASRYAVAYTLHQQINQSSQKSTKEQSNQIPQIADQLTHLEGAHAISSHLCLVASGLMPRPDRPNSDVIFRPYSSQDSHILMQLKRTVEIISVQDDQHANRDVAASNNSRQRHKRKNSKRYPISPGRIQKATLDSPSRGRIKTLLDGALRAGKAARNEDIVPEIATLKQYCLDDDAIPPKELGIAVTEAVVERAIAPSVASCVARLSAMEKDTAKQISRMRQRVYSIVDELTEQNMYACLRGGSNVNIIHDDMAIKNSSDLKRLANKLLHVPTVQLRQGKLSDDEIEDAVVGIERQLRECCNANS